MSDEARIRINTHRLMRATAPETDLSVRVDSAQSTLQERDADARVRLRRRIWVHVLCFGLSFVFTTGASVLCVLLWVRPDNVLSILLTIVFSSTVFVGAFATLRYIVLHKLSNDYRDIEDDPGATHHISKSIIYGVVALVLAMVIVGLLVNVASAHALR